MLLLVIGAFTGSPSLASTQNNTAAQPSIDFLQAYQATLDNNDDLFAKRAMMEAEKEGLNQAWGGIRPNISASGSYGHGEYSTTFARNQSDTFHRTALQVVQPLYSAQRFRTISREQENAQASELQFRLDQQTTALDMTQAYVELSRSQRMAEIAQNELEDHKIKFKRLQAMLDRGLATRMDILEAQSKQDEIRANVITTRNQVIVNQKRLERLIGQPVGQVQPLNEALWQRAQDLTQYDQAWFNVAQHKAISLQVARADLDIAKQDVRINQAGHHPEINLRAEYINSDSYENTFQDNQKIQIEFSLPLYEGGITTSRVRAAHNQVTSRQFALRDRERFVNVKIKETLTRLQASVANIDALQQSIASNEAYLEAAERGLALGVRGVFDVLEAKAKSYNTERRMVEEIYANLFAQFELLYLMGQFDYATLADYLHPEFNVQALKGH